MKLRKISVATFAVVTGVAAAAAVGCGDDDDNAVRPDASAVDAAPTADAAVDARVGKGARTLGLAVTIGDTDFADSVARAQAVGASATDVTLAWDQIERLGDAGTDDSGDAAPPIGRFNSDLHVANLLLSDRKVQEVLALPALDVGGSRAPRDLVARAFDDAELGSRYDQLVDYALGSSQDVDIPVLFVGTDVDVALGEDTTKHAAFATFVTRAVAHLHAVRPKIKVGFTVSATGISAAAPRLAAAWAASDVVGIEMLPGLAAGKVPSPAALGAAFDAVVAAAPADKPIVVHHVGAPSSVACGSDEAQQEGLVRATFEAWDRHADRIGLLVVQELTDPDSNVLVGRAARYRRDEADFLGFLGSLGLRTADRRDKPGFAALGREARARGF